MNHTNQNSTDNNFDLAQLEHTYDEELITEPNELEELQHEFIGRFLSTHPVREINIIKNRKTRFIEKRRQK
jgi:hypothetical protein